MNIEQEAARYRRTLKCSSAHITFPDANANGYQHVLLECHKCDDRGICLRFAGDVENHLNLTRVKRSLGDRLANDPVRTATLERLDLDRRTLRRSK